MHDTGNQSGISEMVDTVHGGIRNHRLLTSRIVFSILAAVWAGAIIGVSLISTPAKFQAPSLSMPVGLEVGRYTFRLFSNLELAFLIAVIVSGVIARIRTVAAVAVALVAVQVLLQRYWLLPELDQGVSRILAGGPIVFSASHGLYAVFEVLKASLLIAAAAIALRTTARQK